MDRNIVDLNERKVLLIDDVVTTGTTAGSIISAILKVFPRTRFEVFSLAWTPTYRQQIALGLEQQKAMYVSEPEESYGNAGKQRHTDEGFENGETFVSLYWRCIDRPGVKTKRSEGPTRDVNPIRKILTAVFVIPPTQRWQFR
ncbi:phosphoribosyltransferase [Mucilaginibacter frigoritolerans]|uniref:phosphoribosyltransferase n=1 Tax=Mucilaginibacter frigoritolerans TaxID=652788 RepID=UPI0011A741BB|nr:phosphoribosyltransferase [Mucilaginibacter frigoritolerans]